MVDNNRIYAQYADKPKAVEWYNITPTVSDEIFNVYEQVRNSYDIDNVFGEQLNVIGRIVVVDRGFESFIVVDNVTQFGGDDSQFGGALSQFETISGAVSDETSDFIFRMLIKSKIAKNNGDATLDNIVESLSYITNVNLITVVDNEDMTFSVAFGEELSELERFVFNTFDIVPRPQGVDFLGYIETPTITRFGGIRRWGNPQARFKEYIGA